MANKRLYYGYVKETLDDFLTNIAHLDYQVWYGGLRV